MKHLFLVQQQFSGFVHVPCAETFHCRAAACVFACRMCSLPTGLAWCLGRPTTKRCRNMD